MRCKKKRACKPTHRDTVNLTTQAFKRKEAQQETHIPSNKGFRGYAKVCSLVQPLLPLDRKSQIINYKNTADNYSIALKLILRTVFNNRFLIK
jgi:hypothetical protein